jgi:two-component system, chemotaxis family, protein-glutamate methylesterase/glutaminase
MPSSPRLVVIAASAGALPAIMDVLEPLPSDFPAAIAVVQHRGAAEPQRLIELLARRTRLRVQHAQDGAALEPGTVYICPPGVHMTTEQCVRLIEGPKIRSVQPNADLMFESVGRAYGEGAIGVVLSGAGSDAALGSAAIANAGGTVIAQDPRTCEHANMPRSAAQIGSVDLMLSPAEIAAELRRLVGLPVVDQRTTSEAPTRVLLADDHRMLREGLRVLLEAERDIEIVSHVEDGETAIRAAAEFQPDVVVMDIRMPGIDGIEATRQILTSAPATRVVALSAEFSTHSVADMFAAGACGYLTKHRAYGELVQAIHTVMRGKIYLGQEVARLVASGALAPPIAQPSRGV